MESERCGFSSTSSSKAFAADPEEQAGPEMDSEYLVFTAVGADRPGIVAELTALLAERGANVADSRMALLGGEFALIVLVAAPPEGIPALRQDLEAAAPRLGLQLVLKETGSPAAHRTGR